MGILGRLEMMVLGNRFGAYHESLSANTAVEENSTQKQIHQDFLKPCRARVSHPVESACFA